MHDGRKKIRVDGAVDMPERIDDRAEPLVLALQIVRCRFVILEKHRHAPPF